ncbi:hypothetical protein HHK36_000049 [Tetracentron sinense]|uniref:Diphosphomevalonate decarboxylase-like N-terminal domain-containing protein n=1 Tax=Tetracentron sinense TaxID=13715 RepID=A0A834ZQE9_TETSI|nr:hypothetical protein HHK36_000049 [Tetracentron sinense]
MNLEQIFAVVDFSSNGSPKFYVSVPLTLLHSCNANLKIKEVEGSLYHQRTSTFSYVIAPSISLTSLVFLIHKTTARTSNSTTDRGGGGHQGKYLETSPGSVCRSGMQRLVATNLEDGPATSRVKPGAIEVVRFAVAGGRCPLSEGGRSDKEGVVCPRTRLVAAATPQDHLVDEVHSVLSKQADMDLLSPRCGRSWPIDGESSEPKGVTQLESHSPGSESPVLEGFSVVSLANIRSFPLSALRDYDSPPIPPIVSKYSSAWASPIAVGSFWELGLFEEGSGEGAGVTSLSSPPKSGEGSNPAPSSQLPSCFAEAASGGCGKSPSSFDPTLSKTQAFKQPESPVNYAVPVSANHLTNWIYQSRVSTTANTRLLPSNRNHQLPRYLEWIRRYESSLREICSWASDLEDEEKGIRLQKQDCEKLHVHIASCNNYTTAARLASSFSGFACLDKFHQTLSSLSIPSFLTKTPHTGIFMPEDWLRWLTIVDAHMPEMIGIGCVDLRLSMPESSMKRSPHAGDDRF